MKAFQQLGNDLYTGKRSFKIVQKRKLWFLIAAIAVLISIVVPVLRSGFNFGIEFTGGSEFHISQPTTTEQQLATDAVGEFTNTPAKVQTLGDGAVRVQTDPLSQQDNDALREALAKAYGTDVGHVNVSTIGPSWGADITRQMLIGLGVFVVLVSLFMAVYFRTWKMALAGVLALAQDLIVTMGIYALTGFEVTPATVIGFLTILGYSLYDKVVVFDKIRENTATHSEHGPRTFPELVNLAINQTLVRSINTSVVALLPVAAILFIGAFVMGAGTLRDISLALFIGIAIGAVSTIFLAGPIYAALRSTEADLREIDEEILEHRGEADEPIGSVPISEDDDEEDEDSSVPADDGARV